MFNKQNFCHIASNNRNEVKVGVFVYKTTDNLATVTTNGYFNEKIVDINLHDLIIHEWHDPADRTKVQRNVLCVTERTLDNVGTAVIKSKWEGDIEQDIADLQTYVDNTFVRKDGTSIMSGPIKFRAGSFEGAIAGALGGGVEIYSLKADGSIDQTIISITATDGVEPARNNNFNLGSNGLKWKNLYIAGRIYAPILNNGVDLTVPTPAQADKLALKSEVDTAANSGTQLTNKGVWFAKMYAATTVPTGAEYDGKNYADFSQVDTGNNPIIVLYEGQNGAWVETDIIAPPANYNGYVTITSKIWDIAEQSGQQGGLVLWAFNTKTFTPYPRIVSFEDAHLTGTPTAPNLSAGSPNTQIVNKQSLDNAITAALAGYDTPELFDWKWRDATTSKPTWKLSDGNWINKADAETAYQHLVDDVNAKIEYTMWKDANSNYVYARYVNPGVGDKVYTSSALTTEAGEITAIGSGYITVGGINYDWYGWYGWTVSHDTTPSGTQVYYSVADDGHRIIETSDSAANAMYSETGVAWYYILDIPNQRFKLPQVNPATQNVQLSMPVITTETEHTTTGLPQMKMRDTSGARPSSTQSLAVASDGGLRNAGGATASSWYGSPTNLYADPTQATGVFVGKKHLYFYIGQ